MHELSVARNLIELACDAAQREGVQHVRKLNLRIGAMSGVAAESLLFSFQAAAAGTACERAELCIEHVPLQVHCPNCRESKTLDSSYGLKCPTCGHAAGDILGGRELELVSLEVDGDAAEST